jgi:acetyl esterase/lipase
MLEKRKCPVGLLEWNSLVKLRYFSRFATMSHLFFSRRARFGAVFAGLLCCANGLQAGDGAAPPKVDAAEQFEVQIIRDVVYRDLYPGEDSRKDKNRLDLYLPRDKKDFPVLFFVHGGAWVHGDKNFLGIYSAFALYWAHRGVGTVVPNYRLSPDVKHPEHIKDVATAFAWTHKNVEKYNGRPDQIFLSGHSAGGHLISLLATDESYLKAEGLGPKAIKGVIPLSGVYRIHELNVYAGVTIQRSGKTMVATEAQLKSTPLPFVFGKDPKVQKEASPLTHVKTGLPPFLIFYAENDIPTLPEMAKEFAAALKEKNCACELVEVKKRRHMSLLMNSSDDNDPVAKAIAGFLAEHTN